MTSLRFAELMVLLLLKRDITPPPLDPSHVPSFSVTLRCELLAKFKHEMNNYSKEQAGRILLDKLPYILS